MIFSFIFFFVTGQALSGTIKLSWDPVYSGVAGYKIYYGTSSGSYTANINVGNVTTYNVDSLQECVMYYFAVKSYNSAGVESLSYSNEVSGLPKPVVQSLSPASAEQGKILSVTITGLNFDEGARPEFDTQDISIINYYRTDCNEIFADIMLSGGDGEKPAELGKRALSVINSDNIRGTLQQAFEVNLNVVLIDVDRNGKIDGIDLSMLARHFGTQDGQPYYEPTVDFNGDGWVDGNDLSLLSAHFGEAVY